MNNWWSPSGYQRTAQSFLLTNLFHRPEKAGALFLDPGMGKTSIVLSTLKIAKYAGHLKKGVLIIVPIRPMYNTWPAEMEKWRNLNCFSYTFLHEGGKQTLWGPQKDIYFINPEGLNWLYYELLNGLKAGKKCPFDIMGIDESSKFKNPLSKRFDLLSDMLPIFKRRFIMTGTPSPKGLLDIWSQIYLLDEGNSLDSNFYKYRSTYFHKHPFNEYKWLLNDFADEIIYNKVAPICLRMDADTYLDMPGIVYNQIQVQLPPKAFRYYKQMEREFFIQLEGLEASAEAAVHASKKCHQIANGRVYEDPPEELEGPALSRWRRLERRVIPVHKAKQEAIRDLVDELNGKPLLIAYYYQHDLDALRDTFGREFPYIGRGVSNAEAQRLENLWNAGDLPYLGLHPDTGAHGLNLQGVARDLCFYSVFYNTENYLQFVRRIYRRGVTGKVRAHHLIAKGTVDHAIMSTIGDNAQSQKNFLDAIRDYRNKVI